MPRSWKVNFKNCRTELCMPSVLCTWQWYSHTHIHTNTNKKWQEKKLGLQVEDGGMGQCQPNGDIADGWGKNVLLWISPKETFLLSFFYPRHKVIRSECWTAIFWGQEVRSQHCSRCVVKSKWVKYRFLDYAVSPIHASRACTSPTSFEEPFSGSSPDKTSWSLTLIFYQSGSRQGDSSWWVFIQTFYCCPERIFFSGNMI